MSLCALAGDARMESVSPLLLKLRARSEQSRFKWIWVTATQDPSHSCRGTRRANAVILWTAKSDFDAMVASFSHRKEVPFILAYDDSADTNNIRLFRYLDERIRFAPIPMRLQPNLGRSGPAVARTSALRPARTNSVSRRAA